MISKRKIYKLQEEAASFAKELIGSTHDDPTIIAYFIGVIEGLRTAEFKKIDQITILDDLIRFKTDELNAKVIKKAVDALKAQSCESENSDD